MNPSDAMTLMLLVAHFLALAVAIIIFFWIILLQRRNRATAKRPAGIDSLTPLWRSGNPRPTTWLAVRTLEADTVRAALVAGEELVISPRVNGWVIVTGPGLPNPGDDVEGCFRFLTTASRKLGHAQFFYMEKFSGHHSWARLDEGCVTRAYAWTGATVWNQGTETVAERRLGMKCFGYGEEATGGFWDSKETAAANIEKIPLLAARWSLDPEMLHRAGGSGGDSSPLY